MSLQSEIQTDIANAFDSDLADTVTTFTATREIKGNPVDDWLDGDTTTTTTYSGRGVFSGYNKQEIDGNSILATDTKLICLQNEVTDTPQADDILNGYRVQSVGKDPANATYTIQLRES